MKAAVSLRLRETRTEFQVFFPYSDVALRTALVAVGVYYAAARSYVLRAIPQAVDPVHLARQQLGVPLHVPSVPALATVAPVPTSQQTLLSRYCQLIALKRYSPDMLKNYRVVFHLFLTHHAPRLPLELSKQDVHDYMAGRVATGISETYHNLLINVSKRSMLGNCVKPHLPHVALIEASLLLRPKATSGVVEMLRYAQHDNSQTRS